MIESNKKKISFDDLESKYPELSDDNVYIEKKVEFEFRQKIRDKKLRKNKIKRYVKSRLIFLCIGLFIVVNISTYALQLIKINGVSMEPTLMEGSYTLFNKRAYVNKEPERFDIIVFELIEDSHYNYVKRVIGLPGETIRIEHGSIFIDDVQLLDPIFNIEYDALFAKNEIILDEDEYFVMGDNRLDSLDSRDLNFGNVKRTSILGEILNWDD